jgi:hypothetical protein
MFSPDPVDEKQLRNYVKFLQCIFSNSPSTVSSPALPPKKQSTVSPLKKPKQQSSLQQFVVLK